MLNAELKKIADFIKLHNGYFADGFSYAWQDGETGHIYATMNGDRRPIFPDDRLSDYFYLRPLRNAALEADRQLFPLMGCNPSGTVINTSVRLVATVNKADADLLVARLINVLAFANTSIRLTSFNTNAEEVLIDEMKGAAYEDVEAALQRITRDLSIISIDFILRIDFAFKTLNCLPEICPPC